MTQCTSSDPTRHFSPSASLAALGAHLRQIDLFGPVRDRVKIAQKTVKQRTVPVNCSYWVSIESVKSYIARTSDEAFDTKSRYPAPPPAPLIYDDFCAPMSTEDVERESGRRALSHGRNFASY